MVELVDDHDVELTRVDRLDTECRQRLDRGEHVPPPLGSRAADVGLAEGAVPQHRAEHAAALAQDLLAMGDEQQRGVGPAIAEPPVVEGGDHGLAGAGGGHDEVAPAVVPLAFGFELVEDAGLERLGRDVEEGDVDAVVATRGGRRATPGLGDGGIEAFAVALRVVVLELRRLPVGIEGGPHLREQLGVADGREADVPLEPEVLGRDRQVRRADVGRRVAGVAGEQPGLGVQARVDVVVGHPHPGAGGDQLVERSPFGRPEVGGGDEPDGLARGRRAAGSARTAAGCPTIG